MRYQNSGQHSITAKLPADAVAADNARYTVLDFPQAVPVLVIDGDPKAMSRKGDAYFVSLPFAASTVTPTGVKPQIESPRFLRKSRSTDSTSSICWTSTGWSSRRSTPWRLMSAAAAA